MTKKILFFICCLIPPNNREKNLFFKGARSTICPISYKIHELNIYLMKVHLKKFTIFLILFVLFSSSSVFSKLGMCGNPPNISEPNYRQQVEYDLYTKWKYPILSDNLLLIQAKYDSHDKFVQQLGDNILNVLNAGGLVSELVNADSQISDEVKIKLICYLKKNIMTRIGIEESSCEIISENIIASVLAGYSASQGNYEDVALYVVEKSTETLFALYGIFLAYDYIDIQYQYTMLFDVLNLYYSYGGDLNAIANDYNYNLYGCPEYPSPLWCYIYNALNDNRVTMDFDINSNDEIKLIEIISDQIMNISYMYKQLLPSPVQYFQPYNGVNINNVVFAWSPSTCPYGRTILYNLELKLNNATVFKTDDMVGMLSETRFKLPSNVTLLPNTTYDWAIFPKNIHGVWNLQVDDWGSFTTGEIEADNHPTASFVFTPNESYTNAAINFDASLSFDNEDGYNLEYAWKWSDDDSFTAWTSNKTASHQYSQAGVYTVQLKVRDSEGLESTCAKSVTVSQPISSDTPPTVEITSGPSGVITYDTPSFTYSGNDSDGAIAGYYRVINSSDEINGENPSETYFNNSSSYQSLALTNGIYTFYVRSKDNEGGLSPIVSRSFTVSKPIYDENSAVKHLVSPETISLRPGEVFDIVISYQNMSNTDWKKIPGDRNHIELRSVSADGSSADSYLYPGDGKWLDNNKRRVCNMVYETVAGSPSNENAWFEFQGMAPTGAAPTSSPIPVYFRLFSTYENKYFGQMVSVNINILGDDQQAPEVTKKKWDFNDNTAQGWIREPTSIPNPFIINNGELFISVSGADPYITSPVINVLQGEINYLKIIARHSGFLEKGKVYLWKDGWNYFNENNSVEFDFPAGGGNKTIILPLTVEDFPDVFNGDGKPIVRLRIDPIDQGSGSSYLVDEIYIDSVEFGKDTSLSSLKIWTPTLGEDIGAGTDYTIKWTATDSLGVQYIDIQTIHNGGYATIAYHIPNSGFFMWTTPDDPGSCQVKITAYDSGGNLTYATSPSFDIVRLAPPPPTNIYEIKGYVKDSEAQPISGVSIKITNQDTGKYYLFTTTESGYYGKSTLPAGTYEVYCYIPGYSLPSNTISDIQVGSANPSATVNFTATLITYCFGGYITLPDETGVQGIAVTASGNGNTYHAITDSNGRYSFCLPPETYEIKPTSNTYAVDPLTRSLFVGNTYFGLPDQDFTASFKNGDFVAVTELLGISSLLSTHSAAWGDFDNDGLEDLYLANDTLTPGRENILYRNLGNQTFQNVAVAAGVADDGHSFGCFWADYNGDGWLDLYVTNADGPNRLYRNNTNGTFTDVAASLGLDLADKHTLCAAFADYDNDGDLDLFVGVSNDKNLFFKNNGGTFVDATVASDLGGSVDINVTSCTWADYNKDGWIDLYVGRQMSLSRLYKNKGDGTFEESDQADINNVYSAAWGDYNNDGYPDLFGNSDSNSKLLMNNGDGTFNDATDSAGMDSLPIGIGSVTWLDYDNDGWQDIYIGVNGGRLFHNKQDGTFEDLTSESGAGCAELPYALAVADYDNNGVNDLFIGQLNQNLLFKGKDFGNQYIKVKLQGNGNNQFGVGAVVRVCTDEGCQYRTITVGTGMSDMNSLTTLFGLGSSSTCDIRVFWPDGTEDEFYDQGCNYEKTVIKEQGQDSTPPDSVADLAVIGVTETSIEVAWTAVGDDGHERTAQEYELRYALFPINDGNWNSAIQVADAPAPSLAGEAETYLLIGLSKNQEYYIGLKTVDERGNVSAISNVISVRTGIGKTIFNLAAGNITATSVGLSWTVPDGVSEYDIRYSTSSISESNWDTLSEFNIDFLPTTVGSKQSCVIDGLSSDTEYYFGIKALDSFGEDEGLSNIATARTLTLINNQLSKYGTLSMSCGDYNGFGRRIIKGGDLNGDGYDDIVVPILYHQVNVYFGGEAFNGDADLVLFEGGSAECWYAEYDNVSVGDVNGDGFNDVIVGDRNGGDSMNGKVYIYLGGSGMDAVCDRVLDDGVGGSRFGYELKANGDVNGDGFNDIIINSYMTCPSTISIYLGKSNVADIGPADRVMALPCTDYPISIATQGDLNSDGYSEIIFVDKYNNNIAIYNGNSDINNIILSSELSFDCTITNDPTQRGYDIGDINNDGYVDLMVGTLDSCNKMSIFWGGNSVGPTADVEINGEATDDVFGKTLAFIGDLNNDGYNDFSVGAPNASGESPQSGKIYAFLGAQNLDTAPDVIIMGENGISFLGSDLTGVGDVNNDGYDDFAASSSNNCKVFVYLGKADLVARTDTTPPSTINDLVVDDSIHGEITLRWTAPGNDADVGTASFYDIRYLASSLGFVRWNNAVKIDNEPAPSIAGSMEEITIRGLVPDTTYNFGIRSYDEWGNVSEISNIASGTFINHFEAQTLVSLENMTSPTIGKSGDFNGDGYQDVIIGKPQYDVSGYNEGALHICFGGANPDSEHDFELLGTFDMQNVGSKIGTGDYNGDGFDDFIVYIGRYGDDYKYAIYHGGDPLSQSSEQEIILSSFPFIISGIVSGDVDGDGKDDMIVLQKDSNTDEGNVLIYYGNDTISATPNHIIDEQPIGSSISSGDINGDGYSEVLVSTGDGSVRIYEGGLSFDTNYDYELSSGISGDEFGKDANIIGDFNGDGYNDIAIGAPNGDADGVLYDAGLVYIYYGGAPFNINSDLTIKSPPVYNPNYFGEYISDGGDFNNDSFNDIVVYQSGSHVYSMCIIFGNDINDANIDMKIDNIYIDGSVHKMRFIKDFDGDGYDEIVAWAAVNELISLFEFLPNAVPNMPHSPSPVNLSSEMPLQVQLEWMSGDPDSGDILSYDVYFGVSGLLSYVGTTPENSYITSTLDYEASYTWKVIANDDHGNSVEGPEWSFQTIEKEKPAAPSNLSANVDGDTVELIWDDESDNEVGFKVERMIEAEAGFEQIATTTASSYSDTKIFLGNRDYFYRVRAYNQNGDSDYCSEFSIFVPNHAPSILSSPPTEILQGALYVYLPYAEDSDLDNLQYTATQKPLDMWIDAETGRLVWNPGNEDVGSVQVSLHVFDGSEETSQNFTITVIDVNDPPKIVSIFPVNETVTIEYGNYAIFLINCHDPDSDPASLSYTWKLNDSVEGTGSSFNYQPDYWDIGLNSLICEISDGALSVKNEWEIIVQDTVSPIITGIENDIIPKKQKTWIWSSSEPAFFRYSIDSDENGIPAGGYSNENTASIASSDGIWYLHVQAKDPTGNESQVKTVFGLLDNTPPNPLSLDTVTTPVNVTPQVISGSKDANTSVWLNGSEIVALDTETTWSYSHGLTEGDNNLSLTSKDAAGNESGAVTGNIVYDVTLPTDPSVASADPVKEVSTNDISITLTWNNGTDDMSGVAGYSWIVDQAPDTLPNTTVNGANLPAGFDIGPANGDWYVHVRTKDNAGNWTNTYHYGPWKLDTVAPTAIFTYDPAGPTLTNQDVVAELEPSEPVTITSNGGSSRYTFTENGTFIFEFEDAAGNAGTRQASVDWIDKDAPTYTLAYDPTGPALTNQDVTATITLSDGTVTSEGGASHTFAENGSFIFTFTDETGNTGSTMATVDWIDKTAPTAIFTYDPAGPTLTNQDVVAELEPSEPVTITSNGGSSRYTFTENGTFIFEFEDAAGNAGTRQASVDWIDKDAPTYTLNEVTSPTNVTPQTIGGGKDANTSIWLGDTAIVALNSATTWSYSLSLSEGNNSISLTSKDAAGNESGAATCNIVYDVTAPTPSISYDPDGPALTNQDVTATITLSDGVITNNNSSLTYVFTDSDTFIFEFVDAAGNTGSATATVNWIDKDAPTYTLVYGPTGPDPTKSVVTATITLSDGTVTSQGGSSHTFTDNGNFTFTFTDVAGNTGSATATVDWIDKDAPTAILINAPSGSTFDNSVYLSVGGDGVTLYKYSLDGSEYGPEMSFDVPISFNGMDVGEHTLRVIGRDVAGNWQPEESATTATWIVMLVAKGDVNNDGVSDLTDAILILKMLAGQTTSDLFIQSDINNDGKIGMEDVLYILQEEASSP